MKHIFHYCTSKNSYYISEVEGSNELLINDVITNSNMLANVHDQIVNYEYINCCRK